LLFGCREQDLLRYNQENRMSTIAINPIHRAVSFWDAPIGKKVAMATTGVILFGYVVGHVLGNLQIYLANPEQINIYAAFLHNPANAGLLWGARAVLLAAVVLHIVASIQLWNLKREARPVAYVKKADAAASYASRTMMWSGPIVGAFVIFHILHLTAGAVPGLTLQEMSEHHPNVRANLIGGFLNPAVSGFYIVAMILLCLHLYHGLWSMFQSLGISHPRYTPALQKFAAVTAILICLGNISIPISILLGVVR
jgi:succinate dehydrogenase / fumarate reductase, cytochrome b subunit